MPPNRNNPLNNPDWIPTDTEVSNIIKRVIYGQATICQTGFKTDDIKALAALLNASAFHEHSRFLFSTQDTTSNISTLLRQEYGFCNACIHPNCDPENPPCKGESIPDGVCAKDD